MSQVSEEVQSIRAMRAEVYNSVRSLGSMIERFRGRRAELKQAKTEIVSK